MIYIYTRGSVRIHIIVESSSFPLGAAISPHRNRGFYGTYVGDIGRNARIEEGERRGEKEGGRRKKKERKGGKPASRWQGAADAPSSLIKTDRPLFFLDQAITRFIS